MQPYKSAHEMTTLARLLTIKPDAKSTVVSSNQFGKVSREGSNFQILTDLEASFDMWKTRADGGFPRSEKQFPNAARISREATEGEDEWRGIGVAEMRNQCNGIVNIEPYYSARRKIAAFNDDLGDYLKKCRPGRRRGFSALDGDLIEDRKFEIEPFATTRRQDSLKIPRLTIVCDTSFNSDISPSFIQKHAALVWALVDMFESVGILCSVYSVVQGRRFSQQVQTLQVVSMLKRFDAYVSPNAIARGLSTAYFRRVMFLYMMEAALQLGEDCCGGLGSSTGVPGDTPTFADGMLLVRSSLTEKLLEQDSPREAAKHLLDTMMPGLREMGLNDGEHYTPAQKKSGLEELIHF